MISTPTSHRRYNALAGQRGGQVSGQRTHARAVFDMATLLLRKPWVMGRRIGEKGAGGRRLIT
jgi:hypothetical protein